MSRSRWYCRVAGLALTLGLLCLPSAYAAPASRGTQDEGPIGIQRLEQVVRSFFENFSEGKVDAALALMADTATWWVAGNPQKFALAGTKTKAQFAELVRGIGAAMPKGLRVTPTGLTAEGDRVAVEAESYGETVHGKIYNNRYHFLIEVRNGKIEAVREYLDTMHAKEVLVDQ